MFPDQKKCICKFLGRYSSNALQALQDFGFTGPPEEFSMYACLIDKPDVLGKGAAFYHEHSNAMRRFRAAYQRSHGLNPAPSVLAKEFAVSA